ncbi:hypothetical protein HYH02_003348 [Chlamydomonas schloesseri]|uniref:RWD domain-containing protein n=1 Tax=Chlamydomonas schloesseri TaxID=2026947 RepID=A0A835WQP0_9CHLO|nr:hypothetical protein HYH02_003348 [Chlamydomonas schloesseri]|eukprot:KAG2452324.1 hypothetical protein HYH02_003348 [Chlamydomonas schloesseri]
MDEDLLSIELEALEATFPDELVVQRGSECSDRRHVLEVLLPLAPRGCPGPHAAFVAGRLRLGVTASYPDVPPTIALLDTKGIGDSRLGRLHQVLGDEAAALAGEMALGALCEHALELITAENTPEGMCAFCLTSVELPAQCCGGGGGGGGGGAESGREGLMRLACFHAFHRWCVV